MLYVDDVATLFSSGVVCNLLSDSNVARCLRITEYSLDTLAVWRVAVIYILYQVISTIPRSIYNNPVLQN